MALKGSFEWFNSLRQGGRRAISFTLTNRNMLSPETFDCAIVDGTGQIPHQIRRQLKLKVNESFTFNIDTCGWDWCNGDYFAILGKKDKEKERWGLKLKIYDRGECPECHGSYRCTKCNGTGTIRNQHLHTIESCQACIGTGVCQKCYVPIRQGSNLANQVYGNVQMPNPEMNRQQKIEALKRYIGELQAKIETEDWNQRMMQLKGVDWRSRIAYSSQMELKQMYERQLLQAEYELQQLENM